MPEMPKKLLRKIFRYTHKHLEELAFNINKYIEGEEIIPIKGSRSINLNPGN